MRPDQIVVATPSLDDDASFLATSKPFEAQALIAEYFPLKLSSIPFCQGLPGSMSAMSIAESASHLRMALLTNAGPLSDRMAAGAP